MSLETGQERHSTFRLWIFEHIDKVASCQLSVEKVKDIKTKLDLCNVVITSEGTSDFLKHISNQTGAFAPQILADTLGFPNRDSIRKSKAIKADLEVLLNYLISSGHLQSPKGVNEDSKKRVNHLKERNGFGISSLEAENAVLKARISQLEAELKTRGKAQRFADVIAKHGVVFFEEY
ncbi:hypothetical protein [Vibrio parahaemolyticus]|nr:hypothetical protein [Vibrio parahaemolyticus]EGR1575955.1 hypothetical protein [Vibrio parahaemolyticus]MDF5090168.1 hypothetical protein [Vibrio parahaemolyticus]MDF5134881.1 hypothetical protein [Vibrio parahaemolyticus]MDF5281694.1 hypothetical protein [Vibrio parahaemolyticus]NMU23663.1 hypothetical protein [Vibrio parahaemolyticus]